MRCARPSAPTSSTRSRTAATVSSARYASAPAGASLRPNPAKSSAYTGTVLRKLLQQPRSPGARILHEAVQQHERRCRPCTHGAWAIGNGSAPHANLGSASFAGDSGAPVAGDNSVPVTGDGDVPLAASARGSALPASRSVRRDAPSVVQARRAHEMAHAVQLAKEPTIGQLNAVHAASLRGASYHTTLPAPSLYW